ncbi:MAG: uroporphyrinogen decarboxylase family protein [Deltaproteobacteria bacterium]|jgi:uroporphyrinogen decarboxylase|nr:uroporphyrinogen decarboxylase family protein [Deltaproteobacteria bacterium]
MTARAAPPDRQTPKERLAAFAAGRPYDRTPCKPFLGQNAAQLFGSSNRAYNTSPKAAADVLEAVFRKFRPDSVTLNAGLQSIPEALGTVLHFPEFGPPRIDEPGLTDYARLDDLEPADPSLSGRLPLFLEAFEDLRSRIGEEVNVDLGLGGPFTAAALLVGLDKFMRDTVHDPENVHRVLKLTAESIGRFIDRAGSLGVSVGLAEPIASNLVVSPKTFRIFAKPYIRQAVERSIKACGRSLGLHICGKTKKIWADVAETGIAGFSLDNLENLAEAREAIGDQVTLLGNVPPVEVLKEGRPEDVLASVKACLEAAAGSPKGFMLASGCEVALGTPAENILAMMDGARLYGQNPDFAG